MKRRLAAITLLIGPHLCTQWGVGLNDRNVPADCEIILIPSAVLLSATHYLCMSSPLSSSCSLSPVHTHQAQLCLYFLSSPPSLRLYRFVFPRGYLAYCFPSSMSLLSVALLLPLSHILYSPSLSLCQALCVFILQPVGIPL